MINSVSSQALIFLWSVFGGAVAAFLYDIFRIQRKSVRTASIVIHIQDLIYWIAVCLIMFGVLYYSNDGEIRGFFFLGAVLGAILYALMLSRIVMGITLAVIGFAKKVLRIVWQIVSYPVIVVWRILSVPLRFISRLGIKLARKTRKAGKNSLMQMTRWRRRFFNRIKKI